MNPKVQHEFSIGMSRKVSGFQNDRLPPVKRCVLCHRLGVMSSGRMEGKGYLSQICIDHVNEWFESLTVHDEGFRIVAEWTDLNGSISKDSSDEVGSDPF